MSNTDSKETVIARDMVVSASPVQREALLVWATELQNIRRSSQNPLVKMRRAISASANKAVLAPLLESNLKRIQTTLWKNRNWSTRLAFVGVAVGTLGLPGKAAGLAAFGRAISIPISLVLAASGALLGALIQELQKVMESEPKTTYSIIEAKEVKEAALSPNTALQGTRKNRAPLS